MVDRVEWEGKSKEPLAALTAIVGAKSLGLRTGRAPQNGSGSAIRAVGAAFQHHVIEVSGRVAKRAVDPE